MNKFSNVAHLGYKKLVISKDILTCSEKAITYHFSIMTPQS